MITYFEYRTRLGHDGLYDVRSWYLFGYILVCRRYVQLTVSQSLATSGEQRA